MKTKIGTVFAAVLLISAASFAQENTSVAPSPSVSAVASKPLVVAGKVSRDRKSLLTDIDSEWAISNPEALRGHEGRRVTVKCYVDTERNKLQVLSVKRAEGEETYSARSTDSAFRR